MESSPNKAIIGIIVIVLLVAAATAVIILNANNESATPVSESSPSSSPSVSPSTASTSETTTSDFKDGTYTADGSYQTPGGRESIGVTVTLSNGVITDASVEQKGERGEVQEYQSKFASGFKALVVGKKVDEVSLTRVSGSSLTPNGFNNAIDAIENQAKA